ncbi:MAG: hypothetical protein ACOY45_02390 [Pseudomonadota bacterium]
MGIVLAAGFMVAALIDSGSGFQRALRGVSDATALQNPDGVWGTLILTDHPEALLAYLSSPI